MPIYEYCCVDHGAFEVLRNMSEAKAGAECPNCARTCNRILSAPHISGVPRSVMVAHETNERSRYEPRVATKPSNCGHSHDHGTAGRINAGHGAAAHGLARAKRYTGARPWVVEHG